MVKHLLRSNHFTREDLDVLLTRAMAFLPVVRERRFLDLAKGKILATIFYEPSTRTRFSFESAMLRLGGQVISNPMMNETSSTAKGETLHDTAKMMDCFADIVAIRHPQAGSVLDYAQASSIPVLNAGDGSADHPTQGLLNLLTIQDKCQRLENLTILMVGDLKNGRVPHADVELLKHYPKNHFIFCTPQGLEMPAIYLQELEKAGLSYEQTQDLHASLPKADIVMQTRIQKERFENLADYEACKGIYVLDTPELDLMKKEAIIMHPLPRVDEITEAVDKDPRAVYFDQVNYGVAMRMAIVESYLGLV